MNEAAVYDVKRVTKKGGSFAAWVKIFRPPFHSALTLPFILGMVLAWYDGNPLSWAVFAIGNVAVILITSNCFLANDYYDLETDKANRVYNRFTGGTRVLPEERLSPDQLPKVGIALTIAALFLGIILQFYFKTGPWTIPLGIIGYAVAFFYTAKPFRLVYHGLGEFAITIGCAWVTFLSGYYLQAHHFGLLPVLVAVAWSPPNVSLIWVMQFPDYEPDKSSGKGNLVVRLGPQKAAIVYIVFMILMWALAVLVVFIEKLPLAGLSLFVVPFAFSFWNVVAMIKGDWRDRKKLEGICARAIVYLITLALAYIGIFIWGGLVR